MSVVETVLIYVGVPALGFAVLAALVYAGGSGRSPRYRPGREWNHDDVWYVPRPVGTDATEHAVPELTGGATAVQGVRRTARGGASGTW